MTLWGVEVKSLDDPAFVNTFPAQSEGSAKESARRINDWVAYMCSKYPDAGVHVSAEVVPWRHSEDAHAEALEAAVIAMMAEPAEKE